jgi:hypothetical protein
VEKLLYNLPALCKPMNTKIIAVALAAVLATGTIAALAVQSAAADHGASDRNMISGDLTAPSGGHSGSAREL